MRKKEWKVIITFASTTEAIRMEKCCKQEAMHGRLIPIPTTITAGCGLSWCVFPEEKETILLMMERVGLNPEGVYELEL